MDDPRAVTLTYFAIFSTECWVLAGRGPAVRGVEQASGRTGYLPRRRAARIRRELLLVEEGSAKGLPASGAGLKGEQLNSHTSPDHTHALLALKLNRLEGWPGTAGRLAAEPPNRKAKQRQRKTSRSLTSAGSRGSRGREAGRSRSAAERERSVAHARAGATEHRNLRRGARLRRRVVGRRRAAETRKLES